MSDLRQAQMEESRVGCAILLILMLATPVSCFGEPSPEDQRVISALQQELAQVQEDIADAEAQDAALGGGLLKSLVAVRLEVLRTNEALIQQRIHALQSGARVRIVVNATKQDPGRAAALAREVSAQEDNVEAARVNAGQYGGGLIRALALSTQATAENTLAMLEQQRLAAEYGLAIPAGPLAAGSSTPGLTSPAAAAPASPPQPSARDCLEIASFDSSVLSSNDVFTELAWKVDVDNSCDRDLAVRVTFTILDANEFELDSDNEDVYVPSRGTGKARGKMLVSPPEKARRMARQGASISLR